MTDKMTLVCVKKTGHVLAFVTRESDPEAKLEPGDVAGETLLVRFAGDPAAPAFNTARFLVPSEELTVEVKDYDDVVVTRSRDFYLDAAQAVVSASGAVPAVSLSGNSQITVDLGTNVTEKTPVWIQVSSAIDPANTQVRESDININTDQTVLDLLPLSTGVHHVLALVAGHHSFVQGIIAP